MLGNKFITFALMKSSELLRLLKKDGWYEIRQTGSHITMAHLTKPGKVIVPFHGANEVKKGLLNGILKEAGIKTTKR